MVDTVGGLTSFSTRPPTPPKERNDTITNLSNDNNTYFNSIIPQAGLDTPDDSPSSSGEYFGVSSDRGSKRVVFSPWTKYHKPLSLGSKNTLLDGHIRTLPPSRDCQSSKSILKPYIETLAVPDAKEPPVVDNSDIPTMLRSVTQQLASTSRSSRLDAYMTMLGCLSAYDDVPDAEALAERLVELTEYIRRDISARMGETGASDTQLATQALKLLTTLLYVRKLGNSIPEDFSSFVLDRSLSAIEDQETPKILVSHYMHLLVKQDFSSKVMTNDRVTRLLSALDTVADRVNGNRVIGHRLMIYQRLLTQTKALMKLRVGDWLDHLVAGMLSTIKDVRSRAIAFGLEASLALGTTSTVSQAWVDIFNRKSPEGRKVVDFLTARLNEMVTSKEDGVHVPQIWSVAILFLRSRRRQVERWEHLKSWLMIIQRCFNSSEAHTKFQANVAWNRLVFAVNPDMSTSSSMLKMLRQPIVTQLDRKTNDKHAKHAKQIARSSYCNLLYYAFRPVPTHAQLDQYWEDYVSQVIPSSFSASSSDLNHACEILVALFGGTAARVWDENRANTGGPVKPEDLPCLDPRWIRQRATTILAIFEKMLDIADWQLNGEEEAPIISAWRSFTAAVGEASSKEVKVSMESLTAVAQILTTIKRFWERSLRRQGGATDQDISSALQIVGILFKEAVNKMGSMPFTEKRFVQSSPDSFEAAETPSSRSSRHQGPLNTPVSHLLHLLIFGLGDGPVSQAYRETVGSLVKLALQSVTTRRSKLEVLRDFARLVSTEGGFPEPAKLALWQLIAEATQSTITLPPSVDNSNDSPQYVGHDYREAIKILEVGLQQQAIENLDVWLSLSKTITNILYEDIGDGGVILVFTEPLAHAALREKPQICNDFILECATAVLKTVSWPKSRQILERAQRVLWGTGLNPQKSQSLDPFNNLSTMVDTLLGAMYRRLESEASATMTDFLAAVTSFVSTCPLSLKVLLLKRVQQGLGLWIEDARGLMAQSKSVSNSDGVYAEIKKLWTAVAVAIEGLPKTDNSLLRSIGDLIVSSLTSRHQAILNHSIKLWNCTFGNADFLEYRDDLRTALAKLRTVTEMQLPNFPEEDIEVMSSPINFIDSQDSQDSLHDTPVRDFGKQDVVKRDMTPKPLAKLLPQSSASSRITSARQSAEKQRPKTTPKARLRHNDSQIHFAAIASSSPFVPEVDDLQLLTEHQKEVKERQAGEVVAIFSDLRSSPRSRSRKGNQKSPPKLVFTGGHHSHPKLDADHDGSPMLPSDNALMKDVLGSSPTPTPRSNRRVIPELVSDFEPPSSPPSLPPTATSTVVADRQSEPPITPSNIMQGQNQSENAEENFLLQTKDDEETIKRKRPKSINSGEESEVEAGTSIPDHPDLSDVLPFSDVDMFVDAPSEPVGETPAVEGGVERSLADVANIPSHLLSRPQADTQPNLDKSVQQFATPLEVRGTPTRIQSHGASSQEDGISGIMDSFYNEPTSFLSNEDDQIAAQLVNDLERASQQASPQKHEQSETKRQTTKRGRKRKSDFESLQRNSKRAKSLSSTQGIEVVVETRKPGDINDCVIVDSRSAVSGLSALPQEVKQERSPSPSGDIRAVAKAHETETNKTRRTRRSTGGAPSFQALPPSSRKRRVVTDAVKIEKDGDVNYIIAPSSRKRRSGRFSQASTDNSQTQDISSGEDYKNSAEVSYDRLSPESSSRDRNSQDRSGSQAQSEVMDQEQDGNQLNDIAAPHQEDEQSETTPRDLGVDDSAVAEGRAPPHLANEALPRTLRKRGRQSKRHEAESPRVAGSAEISLDEEKRKSKRQAKESDRHVKEDDVAMQQEDNPDAAHASRSSARGLLGSFRQLLGDIERVVFGEAEERELTGLVFEFGQKLHESGRRRRMDS